MINDVDDQWVWEPEYAIEALYVTLGSSFTGILEDTDHIILYTG